MCITVTLKRRALSTLGTNTMDMFWGGSEKVRKIWNGMENANEKNGTRVLKYFDNFLMHLLWNWRSSAHLRSTTSLSWILLLYQIRITIICWRHLFESTSLLSFFYLITNSTLPLSHLFSECDAGLKCRNGIDVWVQQMKEADQTKHEMSWCHTVCNEIQIKENFRITAFF